MLDVHVVTSANSHLYATELDEFFEWRYRIYVEDKGWMPANEARRERDQFDDDEAFYLLAYHRGEAVAGSRLRSFAGRTLLREIFPQFVDREMPHAPDQAEWTRMFVVPDARERGHKGVTGAMMCAVMEYCVKERISWIGGIQEAYWLPRWADFGWKVVPLGPLRTLDGTSVVAAMMQAGETNLDNVRAATGITVPQLIHRGPRKPFIASEIAASD